MSNKPAPIHVTVEKNYDSDFCGSIPLHLVNLIQPHGILLVVDKSNLRIIQISENIKQFFPVSLEVFLDKPLAEFLPASQFDDLTDKTNRSIIHEKIPFSLDFTAEGAQRAFTAIVHLKEEYILIELEERTPRADEESFTGVYQQIKYITSRLKQAGNTQETAQVAATEFKKISGFDRVMLYQFDPSWNGVVIAEAKEADMDSYLDLRFPASDVPKQARDLYFKNPYRLIPSREYVPVRLIPIINPLNQRFTDLSDCNLRGVATVHLEYLTNLNIKASMSLPLIIDDKLWGLISCHNKQPKNPSYEMRSAFELLSNIISAQVSAKEKERAIMRKARLRDIHARILEQMYAGTSFVDGLLKGPVSVLDLLSVSGAAIMYDGSMQTIGDVPEGTDVKELISWLRRNNLEKLYATDTLPKQYERSKQYKELVSGLIALPINGERGEYILGFRPEVIQTVAWGGNPNQAIQMEADGKTYHPRNSFATYKETVKYTSLPWEAEEISAAEALKNAVLERIIKEK
jgi:two-component system, chemotaxis family, sensor kinase Cph1